MNGLNTILKIFLAFTALIGATSAEPNSSKPTAIAIHGGYHLYAPGSLSEKLEAEYRAKLREALLVGHEILKNGGDSLDAIEATIVVLEDSPLFNAGKGSAFTYNGANELDASIMEGRTLNAGAVSRLSNIKNPIRLARAVMEKSKHVMLSGEGAQEFAAKQGFENVNQDYFFTERRWRQLADAKKRDVEPENNAKEAQSGSEKKFGTVGAVALDQAGNLAAGTSTGGMTNKRFGRIGDTPIIGAATYADNARCAVSATGHGEFVIRAVLAYDICARMEYLGESVTDATETVINTKLAELGGDAGVVVLDPAGNIAMSFNTPGMFRASIDTAGEMSILIYKDE